MSSHLRPGGRFLLGTEIVFVELLGSSKLVVGYGLGGEIREGVVPREGKPETFREPDGWK